MSNRWSFIKRFGSISYADFMVMAARFIATIKEHHGGEMEVTVTLYGQLPHSITTVVDGLNEWVASENEKLELAKMGALGKVPNIPKELFDRAKNVQLFVHPTMRDITFGHMECKGLLSQHLVFYIQSGDDRVSDKIKRDCVEKHPPSKWLFGRGDGFECCHTLSLS